MKLSITKVLSTLLIILCLSSCQYHHTGASNIQPMYAGRAKTATQLEADRSFVRSMKKQYGNRTFAARHAMATGWTYFQKGDQTTAMKRFNQAWLLDDKLPDVYEGFGVLLVEQGKHSQGVAMLERALQMAPNNKRIKFNLEKARNRSSRK